MDLIGLLKSQFLCHLVFCYVFIASGLIINTIQLFTLLLWPINKQLFRKINCRLSYCVSSRKTFVYSLYASSLLRGVRDGAWRSSLGLPGGPSCFLSLCVWSLALGLKCLFCPHSSKIIF